MCRVPSSRVRTKVEPDPFKSRVQKKGPGLHPFTQQGLNKDPNPTFNRSKAPKNQRIGDPFTPLSSTLALRKTKLEEFRMLKVTNRKTGLQNLTNQVKIPDVGKTTTDIAVGNFSSKAYAPFFFLLTYWHVKETKFLNHDEIQSIRNCTLFAFGPSSSHQ